MIDTLLRRPAGAGDYFADAVRAACLLSLAAATLWHGPVDVALFLLVLMGTLVSRSLDIPRVFDGLYGLTLLGAAWSSVLDLYARVGWWDLPVHFAATAVIAAMVYFLLSRLGAVPMPARRAAPPAGAIPVLVFCLGLAVSVLWELGEWWGYTFVDQSINVGYQDTMGDLAAGGLGALTAGALLGRADRRQGSGSDALPRPTDAAPPALGGPGTLPQSARSAPPETQRRPLSVVRRPEVSQRSGTPQGGTSPTCSTSYPQPPI